MATKKQDEDSHNPFGSDPATPKQGPEPGVFDPGRKSNNDPFKPTDDEVDSEWDEEEPGSSTRDT